MNPMDMRFGFTENDVLSFFTLLGAEGRSVYLFVESVVDVLYPLAYTGFSVLVLSFSTVHCFPKILFGGS